MLSRLLPTNTDTGQSWCPLWQNSWPRGYLPPAAPSSHGHPQAWQQGAGRREAGAGPSCPCICVWDSACEQACVCAYGSNRQRKKRGSKERQKEKREVLGLRKREAEGRNRDWWMAVALWWWRRKTSLGGFLGLRPLPAQAWPHLGQQLVPAGPLPPSHSHRELVSPSRGSLSHPSPP